MMPLSVAMVAHQRKLWSTTTMPCKRSLTDVRRSALSSMLTNSFTRLTRSLLWATFLSSHGILPDPEKVRAIMDMPPPRDVSGVRRLYDCINYLGRFIPNLADITKPLHDLTAKGAACTWDTHHTKTVQQIRSAISSAPVLAYFDTNAPVTVQCDASDRGLGAVLLQRGHPVAYTSRALTDPETRYAQIEKELTAVVYALTKFDQMTYGRLVVVVSDHKPLATILKKPLFKVPRRLQSMIMNILRYAINLVWQPGKEMHVADCLSRAFLETTSTKAVTLSHTPANLQQVEINFLESLPYAGAQLEMLKSQTDEDDSLSQLKQIVTSGWPDDRYNIPNCLLPYWSFMDELSIIDGVIFKGTRLVLPTRMRSCIQDLLHIGHRGIDATLRHARDIVFWPNMAGDVKHLISNCETCQTYSKAQQHLPPQPHELTEGPWQRVGVDLLMIKNSTT